MVKLIGDTPLRKDRCFTFKPLRYCIRILKVTLIVHKNFKSIINNAWLDGDCLVASIQVITEAAKEFNQNIFGIIFKRKQRVLTTLMGAEKALVH